VPNNYFPASPSHLKESDDTEGVWFFLVGSNTKRSVSIYAVQQHILSWQNPEEQDYREFIRCPERVTISIKDEPTRCSHQETAGAIPTCRIFLSY